MAFPVAAYPAGHPAAVLVAGPAGHPVGHPVGHLEEAFPVEAVEALAVQPVGHVAVSPAWPVPLLFASSSGHSSVIYPCAWIA